MDERHKHNVEHFKESMAILMRSAVERIRMPDADDQVYCRCRAAWIGSIDE